MVLPADYLDKAEQARTILIREGLVESIVYLPFFRTHAPYDERASHNVYGKSQRSISQRNRIRTALSICNSEYRIVPISPLLSPRLGSH